MTTYPFGSPAIRVEQPIGIFYITVLPVRLLLDTCYTDSLKAELEPDQQSYSLTGHQRALKDKRLPEIGAYIDTAEATFPNAIILAANFHEVDGQSEEDDKIRWRIEGENGVATQLIIPTSARLAPIIDGQHRLFGFKFAEKRRLDTQLVCSVFLDLPKPYQAFLFATINSTQKPVDKSQTFELFGYNIEDEKPERWSPEKLAVYLARKLNTDEDSPLYRRIIVAAENEFSLSRAQARREGRWMVSMATVVVGISRLVSRQPKQDAYQLLASPSRVRTDLGEDNPPFRGLYLETNDKLIYVAVVNFLKACDEAYWGKANDDSFIVRTVGVQALFDVLRMLAPEAMDKKDVSKGFFLSYLIRVSQVDFGQPFFRNASGKGRSIIRNCLALSLGLIRPEDIKDEEDRAKLVEISGAAGRR